MLNETVASHAIEDYLKTIYLLQQDEGRVTTSALARRLGVAAASVTNMVKRLAEMNLVRHAPYHGVELLPAGEKIALEVVRHHRLLELYLAEALGMPWDQVHAEADRLEHVISEDLEERMAAALGQPTMDPHGHPIPSRDLTVPERSQIALAGAQPRDVVKIEWVSDLDPARLRYLAAIGLVPQATVEVLDVAPFNGPLRLRVGRSEVSLGRDLAAEVFLSRATAVSLRDT